MLREKRDDLHKGQDSGLGEIAQFSWDNPRELDIDIDGNELTVTPNANYNGTVSFTVTADDQQGADNSISEPQTFNLVINPVNDLPPTPCPSLSQAVLGRDLGLGELNPWWITIGFWHWRAQSRGEVPMDQDLIQSP